MFRKILIAFALAAGLFTAPGNPLLSPAIAAAAHTRDTAVLYVAAKFDGSKPKNGLRVYKWYYVNKAAERAALHRDLAHFKAKGWATYVKYE